MIKIGINGFGRIGKLVFRLLHQDKDTRVVAVNDPMPSGAMAHLLRYDTVHGIFDHEVGAGNGVLRVNGKEIYKYDKRQPQDIPWDRHGVDMVVESSGEFLTRDALSAHLREGVRKVILSCPPKEPLDAMVVLGVNEEVLLPQHRLVSNASCTTHCIAPVLKIMDASWGIDRAFMNTVHPFTNSQNVTDGPHTDLRRARCANANIIPTTTSAIKAIKEIMPRMAGRFDGFASRVPVSDGSFVDLTAILLKPVTREEVNQTFFKASLDAFRGILQYCEDPVVSSDIVGNPHSSVFDALSTRVLGGTFVQILAWYDNEYAYACRLRDLIHLLAER